MIILRIADTHHIVWRKAKIIERGMQSARLVDTGRENHDRALVEDHLKFESQIANRVENDILVRRPGRHNHLPDRERSDAALPQRFNELVGRTFTENRFGFVVGTVKQSAIFRDDPIEKCEVRANTYQVIECSSGDENELAPCGAKAFERVDCRVIDRAVVRERSVIIGGKRKIAHTGNPSEITLEVTDAAGPSLRRSRRA